MPDYEGRGGAQITLWYLMRALVMRGHHCTLAAASKQSGIRRYDKEGVRVIEVGLGNLYWPYDTDSHSGLKKIGWHAIDAFNVLMARRLGEVCEEVQPDVASLHNLPGWSVAVWSVLSRRGIPSVQVLHDLYPICVKGTMYRDGHNCGRQCHSCRLFRIPHRKASEQLSGVVGVSRFILDRHRALNYFRGVPIQKVINNARDPKKLGLKAKPARRIGSGGLRVGFIGRVEEAKGVERLIDAFIRADVPGARLLIAGSGKADYVRGLQSRMSDDRIEFCGRVVPHEFFPTLDVAVFPSLWNDTFPGVVFEALAFGTAVLGARRGGIPEMIHEGVNGELFDPDDIDGLASRIGQLSQDIARLERYASNARGSVEHLLDTERWTDSYLATYRAAVNSYNG